MRAIPFKAYKALPLLLLCMNPLMLRIASATCEINLDKRVENPPLILDSNGDIIYPTTGRKLVFSKFFQVLFRVLHSKLLQVKFAMNSYKPK